MLKMMTRPQRLALIATTLGSAVVFLNGAVVGLALPKIGAEFGTDFAGLQWVASGYLLSLSALMLLGGSLGDIFGRKRIYLIGIIGFAVSSCLCAISGSVIFLIGASVLQGVFGALVTPGALAIFETNFKGVERNKAIATWAAWTSAASAIGPFVGGYLADRGLWRFLFVMTLPLLVTCFWLGVLGIRESQDRQHRHIDFLGALLGSLTLGSLIYGLIQGPPSGWSAPAIGSLLAGIVLGIWFLRLEARQKDPMLDLKLFRSANFSAVNLTTFAMYGALGGFFFILVIHLQTVVGFSTLQAGLASLPVTLLLLLFSKRVGILSARFGPHFFMVAGPLITAAGILYLLPLKAGATYLTDILPGMLLFGTGLTLTVTPLTVTLLSSAKREHAGIASAINNAISRAAGLIVIAVLGLFGAAHAYTFATILCCVLAVCAGAFSLLFIRNPVKK